MRELTKNQSLSDVLIIMIITSLTFVFVPAWIPLLRREWILLVFSTLLLSIKKEKLYNNKAIIALFIYLIVLIVNAVAGDAYTDSISTAIYNILLLFVPFSLALYCVGSSSVKYVRVLVFLTFILLLIEFVASLIIFETNPGMIRGAHGLSLEEGNADILYNYYKLGMMDFTMAHAIPILIPPLFCCFKEGSRRIKWISLILIIVCVILVWMSESSTAVLLTLMVLILGLLVNKNASFKKNVFIILITIAVTVIIMTNNTIMSGIFNFSRYLIGDESLYIDRLDELELSLMGGQASGDLGSRMDLYGKSIDMFTSNILFGSNQMPGRHSGILDRLATLGVVGVFPLIVFFIYSLKAIISAVPQDRRIYYLECIVVSFLMLLFKAMWLWPIFLFLYVISPCMLILLQDKNSAVI